MDKKKTFEQLSASDKKRARAMGRLGKSAHEIHKMFPDVKIRSIQNMLNGLSTPADEEDDGEDEVIDMTGDSQLRFKPYVITGAQDVYYVWPDTQPHFQWAFVVEVTSCTLTVSMKMPSLSADALLVIFHAGDAQVMTSPCVIHFPLREGIDLHQAPKKIAPDTESAHLLVETAMAGTRLNSLHSHDLDPAQFARLVQQQSTIFF
eukprot:m51a1_g12749 hypothetical protein (205) ;mRNA; f:243-1147